MALILTLLLFGAPAAAFWLLVGGLDPIGRLVVAGLASMVLVSGVAGAMLIGGFWSPLGGFAAVLVVSAGMTAAALLQRRRTTAEPVRAAVPAAVQDPVGPRPAAPTRDSTEGDEWLFES